MITNKDIRVENGSLIINGDPYPLDGQSPEAIMEIVEDNSDTTPTENSTAPVTSGGVYTALGTKQDELTFDSAPTASSDNPVTSDGIKTYVDNIASGKADVITAPSGGTTQNITVGASPTNRIFLLSVGYAAHYTVGLVIINSNNAISYTALSTTGLTATVSFTDGVVSITFNQDPYSNARLIRLS